MQQDNQESILLLRQVEMFKEFDDESLTLLASHMKDVRRNKNEVLFKKGDPGNSMYIIVEGSVKIHNNEHVFAILNSKQYFGEYSLIDQTTRSTSATTARPSRFLILMQAPYICRQTAPASAGSSAGLVPRRSLRDCSAELLLWSHW